MKRNLALLLVLLVGACSERPRRLSVVLDRGDGATAVLNGVTPGVAKRLKAIAPDDARWSRLFMVRIAERMPTVAGRYEVTDSSIRFTPRFPPEGIASLQVSLDRNAWREATGQRLPTDQDLWWQLSLPMAVEVKPSTRLISIHPSAPVVPANQLRWYLEFSAPMREGEALAHVRLRDAGGTVIDAAFLQLDDELWDASRSRLTLLFDMGRVKQGIRKGADLGPVLVAGGRYSLEIDRGWPDARGAMLVGDSTHRFVAGPVQRGALEPATWSIGRVTAGSRRPLTIDFGRAIDHALAERMIAVTSGDGERMAGTLTLLDGDRRLQFVPAEAWRAIPYQLRVHPALEDVAGNRVGHAFDASIAAGESAGVETQAVVVPIAFH